MHQHILEEKLENLPDSYDYHIITFNKVDDGFEATIRVPIDSKDGVEQWLEEFTAKSKNTFRVDRTHVPKQKFIFKKEYRCHHNTFAGTHNVKKPIGHTGCCAKVTITVKQKNMTRSKDVLLESHPTEILLRLTHNHSTTDVEALSHRRPSKSIEAAFKDLFERGHSPSSALETFKHDLHQEHGDSFYKVAVDRALCPSVQWCYKLYYKLFSKEYTAPEQSVEMQSLETLFNNCYVSSDPKCSNTKEFETMFKKDLDDKSDVFSFLNVSNDTCSKTPYTWLDNDYKYQLFDQNTSTQVFPLLSTSLPKYSGSTLVNSPNSLLQQASNCVNINKDIQSCEENLKYLFKILRLRVRTKPSVYLEPLGKFFSSFRDTMLSENNLVSALQMFGVPTFKSRKSVSVLSKTRATNTINVGVKRSSNGGNSDHSYNKRKKSTEQTETELPLVLV